MILSPSEFHQFQTVRRKRGGGGGVCLIYGKHCQTYHGYGHGIGNVNVLLSNSQIKDELEGKTFSLI